MLTTGGSIQVRDLPFGKPQMYNLFKIRRSSLKHSELSFLLCFKEVLIAVLIVFFLNGCTRRYPKQYEASKE